MKSKCVPAQRLVRAKGLEPPHLAILEPKSSASTNSATPARTLEGARPITARARSATRGGPRTLVSPRRFKHATEPARTTHSKPCPALATGPADPRAARGAGDQSQHRRAIARGAGHPAAKHAD